MTYTFTGVAALLVHASKRGHFGSSLGSHGLQAVWQRLKGGTSSALCSVSTSTKIAIDSALWHEGRGYLEFFNSQTDGYVCTRCMRMGEKLHKLKEDLRETQNQLRELAASILCSMADLDSDTSRDPHLHVPVLASAGASNQIEILVQ